MALSNIMALDPEQSFPTIPGALPLLPIRDIVVFPHMVIPLFVGRESSVKAIESVLSTHKLVLLAAQKSHDVEVPNPEDIHSFGTVSMILRMLKLPDGRVKILVQGLCRANVVSFSQVSPYYQVAISPYVEPTLTSIPLEIEAVIRTVKEQVGEVVGMGKLFLPEVFGVIEHLEDPGRLADMIASTLGLKVEVAQSVLEIVDPVERLLKIREMLQKERDLLMMQQKIHSEAKGEMDRSQREYYLREQQRAIQKELGEIDDRTEEVKEFRAKVTKAKMPEKVTKEAEKQLKRLEKMHPDSAEATTVRTYVEWLVELPWNKSTQDNTDVREAKRVLDEDHYGMEKVKDRVLEYLAVRNMKGQKKEKMKGPILCFVGPPGVGKTSLGRSIARALGREFVRVSLGGIRDEAELRGHRRTYVGALPGRIIQGLKQAGTNNPVFMLDELDKVGNDFRGDPASALLEVLDPEQNYSFSDHYLGVPFDLSNVMFITTANQVDPISSPLRDRMEMIELLSYSTEEKVGIAHHHLLARQIEEHGLTQHDVHLNDLAIETIITQYTREAGVRNLEREIAHVLRKIARQISEGKKQKCTVGPTQVERYLGAPKFLQEPEQDKEEVGVATGLAWTATGGDTIRVEATTMKGKGGVTLTGHLGDVMKESAHAALSYIRSQEKEFKIKSGFFTKHDLHIHVPSGAIPKDGPSAGITMACALVSILTGVRVRNDVAMTGEITLRGRVLPIGGLKEKVLAAKRVGMKVVILPKRNEKDLSELPRHIQQGIQFVLADHIGVVFETAFHKNKNGHKNGTTIPSVGLPHKTGQAKRPARRKYTELPSMLALAPE